MSTSRLLAIPLFLLIGLIALSAQADESKRPRVVFAVTEHDPHIWNEVFGNFHNVEHELPDVEIEMVVYADAIAMLKFDSEVGNRVTQAISEGVNIVACENSMMAQNISKDDMLDGIGYVKAGIVELIKRQNEGWAYIRP